MTAKAQKAKTRNSPDIEFRPHKDGVGILDEVCARDIKSLHIEQLDHDHFWMSLVFDNAEFFLDFYQGGEITDDEGEKVKPIILRARRVG